MNTMDLMTKISECRSAHHLRDARAERLERCEELDSKKQLTAEEMAEVKRLANELEELDELIEARDKIEKRLARAAAADAGISRMPKHADDEKPNFSGAFGANVLSVARSGKTSAIAFDPAQMFKRAVMTSDSGSAGNSLVQSTRGSIYEQAVENVGFLQEFSYMGVANTTRLPYLDRDNRLTAQNKAQTDALTEQAYVISAKTVDFSNYYCYPVLHNDVLRDSALGMSQMEQFIARVAAADVRRQVANDSLNGTGASNNMTGIINQSGILTQDWAAASITDFTLLTNAVRALMDVNVNTANLSVIIPPIIWEAFAETEDSTGQPLQMPEWLRDLGLRIYVSQFMPNNQVIVGDLSKVMLTFWNQIEMSMATSTDVLFSKDQMAIRCLWRGDLICLEPDALLLVDNVLTNT